jgi:4-aminobutyrate aminotransferase-like enzyme
LLNTNSRFLFSSMPRFARRLADLLPEPLDVVFLVNSGSEANDLALRLIRHATGAKDILCLQGSYHGWTTATFEVSTSLSENPTEAVTRPDWVHPLRAPNTFRGPYRGDDAATKYVADAQRVITRLQSAGRALAGFIAEPVMGVQGGMAPPPGYTRAVVELVRKAGGLVVADEVQVGFGRLGHYFWAFEHEKVIPDVVTIAKATGNGYPVAAVITSRELADFFGRDGSWFSSIGGSPVSCAVGLAVLDVIEGERLQDNARRVGDHLRRRLLELVDRYEIAGAAHGIGLYLGIELVRDRKTLEPAVQETLAVCERMRELGVIIQPTGDHENILKVKPPLVISLASADFFVDQLDRVFREGW